MQGLTGPHFRPAFPRPSLGPWVHLCLAPTLFYTTNPIREQMEKQREETEGMFIKKLFFQPYLRVLLHEFLSIQMATLFFQYLNTCIFHMQPPGSAIWIGLS